jgi:serine/threonine-protein kinase
LGTEPSTRSALLQADVEPVLGRYEVIEEVGVGGMGRVYRARDPRLDREVALKVTRLHVSPGSSGSVNLVARLKREAQAMAQLSHPNVVPVYDVERVTSDFGDSLFIAMELVRGRTLKRWLRDDHPSQAEILEAFGQAGRGLVAAHEAGLVHRDFKPANVMVDVDASGTVYRVRVMDFGLVRFGTGESETSAQSSQSGERSDNDLTQDGIVLGTPAYMAPEQHAGETIDARSDQYAFCIALYEALFGERPFSQMKLSALVVAKSEGITRLPASPRVPRRIRRALLRGLAPKSVDRWPTMDALLRRLAPATKRTGPVVVVGCAALVGGVVLAAPRQRSADVAACPPAADELPYLHDTSHREAIRQQLLDGPLHNNLDTWERVASRLDGYASRWAARHVELCNSNADTSEETDRRRICLARAKAEFNTLVETLSADVDDTLARRATRLVTNLPDPDLCAREQRYAYELPPPNDPELQAEVDKARTRLAGAKVHRTAGRYVEALTIAKEVQRTAQDIGFEPLVVEAMAEVAGNLRYGGDLEDAVERLEETYFAALRLQYERVAAQVSSELMLILGGKLGRFEEAYEWADHSWAIVQRVGLGTAMEGRHYINLANVYKAQGRYDETLEVSEKAKAIYEATGRTDSGAAMTNENNIAVALYELGRLEEAGERHRRMAKRLEETLGPEHHEVAISLINLGLVLQEQGRYEQAREAHARALEIFEHAFGDKHTYVATAANNLGWALMSMERHAEARRQFERCLAIREEVLGPDNIQLSSPLINLAQEELIDGNNARARQLLERALVLFEASQAAEHPRVAIIKMNLATIAKAQGELDDARRRFEEAIALMEKTSGPEHPDLAFGLLGLAAVMVEQGHPEGALALIDRADRLWSADFDTPDNRAKILAARANAYWALPKERARALPLARRALALQTDATPQSDRDDLAEWIREHGG